MDERRYAQFKYELESDNYAQAERLKSLIEGSAKGDVDLPRAQALVGRMAGVVCDILKEYAETKTRGNGGKYKGWLRALPLDVAAVIAIRECIRLCSSPKTRIRVQDLTFNVGKLWELEVRIRQAEEVNPVYMQRIHDQVREHCTRDYAHLRKLYSVAIDRVFKGEIDLSLSKTDIIHIGKFGVDACLEAGLIEIERGTCRSGMAVEYKLSEAGEEFLRGYTQNDVRNVINVTESRMLCQPDPWTNLEDGGYLTIRRKAAAPLIKVSKIRKAARSAMAAEFTAENMPRVFDAGNYLQSIPYEYHVPTRDAILRVWNSGGNVLGIPSKDGPKKPEFPYGPEWDKNTAPACEVDVFNRWKRRTAMYHDELRAWRGHVREIGAFLKTVRGETGPYWFPVYCDTRGRWYYRGIPNLQGSDMSKATLHFHEKKPLGKDGLFWLKVHIANSAGFDKERFIDRARWTEQNWPAIERALDCPEDYPEVFGKDAPWCMFSAAWEYREALRSGNPEEYKTGIPVHMDATCSGLQHFSALLRDPVGASYVNLSDPTKCGPKQDIYGAVATSALRMMQRDLESSDENLRRMAEWCMQVGIPRSLAKKPVMTYVYGATLGGTTDHVEYMLEREILPELGKSFPTWEDVRDPPYAVSQYIARKLFAGIAATVPAAAAAMQWLMTIARQQPNGKRMTWRTPSGFVVQHDYQDYSETRLQLKSCGITHTIVRYWNEGTRPHAMANAISPNFVHALDASHLVFVANAMARDGLCMVGIHDSFGTHPCDVGTMHSHIRREFVNLYSGPNLLTEFLWDVGGVGEPPARGNFDIEEVLDSEFMFC